VKKVLLGVVAVLSLGACGGQDAGEATADCRKGFTSAYESATPEQRQSIPRSAWEESGRRLCTQAVEEHLLTGGESDEEIRVKIEQFVKAHPDVLHPICVGSALSEFAELTAGERTPETQAAYREFGRRYCNAAIREGIFTLQRHPTEQEIDDVFRRDPSVTNGVCVAGGLHEFESEPFVVRGKALSRAQQKLFLTRFCTEAAEAGLFTISGDFTPAQQRQLAIIFERVRGELIASGDLP
jgi:hypothetical protein